MSEASTTRQTAADRSALSPTITPAATASGRRDNVYRAIRESILSGAYRPAQRLVEADLASQFGVSKTPVREVLYRLEEEGLVSSARNRGFTVRVITAKEMRNIYELRELYEGACARAAACSEGRANLAALLRDYNSAAAAALAEGDIQLVHAKFSAFDDAIFAQSSNELLREQVDHISALISLGGTMSNLIPGRIPKSISQHEAIADAIGANDPTAAERLTREHIRSLFEDQLRGTAPGYASDRRTG